MRQVVEQYFQTLSRLPLDAKVTAADGSPVAIGDYFDWAVKTVRATHDRGNRLLFIGNGGSAGICSHMATDYMKNGRMRATAFNDGAVLTCLSNDLGYENVFSEQIAMHGREGDLLIAISSSGGSPNIVKAAQVGREMGMTVMTLTGFKADNPLRKLGDYNLWIDNGEYGFVELSHQSILHAILDIEMGWRGQSEPSARAAE